MLRKLMIAVIALGLGVTSASAQSVLPYPRPIPGLSQGPQNGYWVQFRQPYWRQQEFASEPEMMNYVLNQRALGWELQVIGPYVVRYRLMQWGGSRIVPTLPEAQQWAAMLEDQGYEPRIVRLSP